MFNALKIRYARTPRAPPHPALERRLCNKELGRNTSIYSCSPKPEWVTNTFCFHFHQSTKPEENRFNSHSCWKMLTGPFLVPMAQWNLWRVVLLTRWQQTWTLHQCNIYPALNLFFSEMSSCTFWCTVIFLHLNYSCMPNVSFSIMLSRWIFKTVFHVYLLSCTQVNLVWKSGPSGAHAQLLVVKGRRCEPELVYHLTGHTAAAH